MVHQSDTRQRILEAARDLMYASSYADVGVAAICEKAQVKKGSFYHFFVSKQELTLAVIDSFYADLKDSILDQAFDANLPPLGRLMRFIEVVIDTQAKLHAETGHVFGCPFGNLATELSTQDETIRFKLDHLFKKLHRLIRDTLREAVAAGEMEVTDTDAQAEAFLAYFEGCMLMAKTHNDPAILRRLLPVAATLRL